MPLTMIEHCAVQLARLPRLSKRLIAVTADSLAMPAALWLALALRRGSAAAAFDAGIWLYVSCALIGVAVFTFFGLYRAVFRFISRNTFFIASGGVLVTTALLWLVDALWLRSGITPRSLVIFDAFALLYMASSRTFVREVLYYRRGKNKERVVIYGAGTSGAQLARTLREDGNCVPVAFLDSDRALQGGIISGIKVFAPSELPALIDRERVSSVLLAIPSCSRRRRQKILKELEPLPVHVRTVPDITDIVAGRASVADIREVDANDLLGRDAVAPNEGLLDACVRGKVVMVSGAGGSIGSELCRQIILLGPKRLVLVEVSEPALYQIEREMRAITCNLALDVEVVPLLGNVHHRNRVRDIMQKYAVQTVYHAAAYKHVPIVEQNIVEGIHNNVFGSWHTAEAALECRVETFVLISTDKAVNPSNVMGATKRLAELTLQGLQERSTVTRFCMVRFGNVLESSGSVVPLFREQIKRGGPVTVTHRDVIRYFMTIPEASQLVIQAGSMATGGDVFVLDMGQPVRIEDLARRMVNLMGLTVRDEQNPEGDIEIVYTGLRPAEKLFEELLIGSNVTGTQHPMIMRATEPHVPWSQLKLVLEEMSSALDAFDCEKARSLLTRTVAEYRPEAGIQDLVWLRGQQGGVFKANVAVLDAHRQRTVKQLN